MHTTVLCIARLYIHVNERCVHAPVDIGADEEASTEPEWLVCAACGRACSGRRGDTGNCAVSQEILEVDICVYTHVHGSSVFSRKSDCLGCAVVLCLVCLFDLACFFLSSFSSLIKNMYVTCTCM